MFEVRREAILISPEFVDLNPRRDARIWSEGVRSAPLFPFSRGLLEDTALSRCLVPGVRVLELKGASNDDHRNPLGLGEGSDPSPSGSENVVPGNQRTRSESGWFGRQIGKL